LSIGVASASVSDRSDLNDERNHDMPQLSGTIWVDEVMREGQRRQGELAAWAERNARHELRREEQAVLREWWRANEKDRPEIVRKHQAVFARIKENRRRAWRIEQAERAISDARMRALGYLIRPGRVFPRYVRSAAP
jgi:hypothetical protein